MLHIPPEKVIIFNMKKENIAVVGLEKSGKSMLWYCVEIQMSGAG